MRKLELHVFPWNEPAIRLYETFGFEREGYRRSQYVREGEDVDAILMAYRIPPQQSLSPVGAVDRRAADPTARRSHGRGRFGERPRDGCRASSPGRTPAARRSR